MAGYNGFSKSNNAVHAERNGRHPASVVAKMLGVPSQFVKQCARTSEWHHSSKFYNCVQYYDLEVIQEWLESEEGMARLEEWKKGQKKKTTTTRVGCRVEWLEWSGTRNHPRATERVADGCAVTDEGGLFYKIKLPDGKTMRKKKDCRGLKIS